ncbi:hypothetical protein [Methanobacterium sp. ACI-7]|uniref:hypothetical protein n=1 Tax=unclassified Methanobacterium TaxID=2627676 RepID=UPI0039C34243
MNKSTKSVGYFFLSRGFDIFASDEDNNSILVSSLICSNCGHPWYIDLAECFLCGMINTYTLRCCDKYYPITKSNQKCPTCRKKLVYACTNPQCLSNLDKDDPNNDTVYNATQYANDKRGVFSRNNAFNMPLSYCLNCENESYIYKTQKLMLLHLDESEIKENILNYINRMLFFMNLEDSENENVNKILSSNHIQINFNDLTKEDVNGDFNLLIEKLKNSKNEGILLVKLVDDKRIYYSTNLISQLNINNNSITITKFENNINMNLFY